MSEDFWAEANRQRHRAFATACRLGDAQMAREHRAQALFFPALARFAGEVRGAAALSSLMARDFACLLDALDDHAPTRDAWDEKIAGER